MLSITPAIEMETHSLLRVKSSWKGFALLALEILNLHFVAICFHGNRNKCEN